MYAELEAFIRLVADIFDAHTAALFIRVWDNNFLKLVVYHSLSSDLIPNCEIEIGKTLIGTVAKQQRPLCIGNFDRDIRTLGIYKSDVEIKSFLAHPLPDEKGVLMIDSRSTYTFSPKHQRLMAECTILAGEIISSGKKNARLNMIDKWHKLINGESVPTTPKAMLEAIAKVLEVNSGLVAIQTQNGYRVIAATCEQPKNILSEFTLDQGLVGWIFRHKRDLRLCRSQGERKKSFFVHPKEPFKMHSAIIGLYISVKNNSYVWIFTGDTDMRSIPDNLSEIFVPYLRLMLMR